MTTLRDAVLQGSLEAAQLHADAGLGPGSDSGTAPIDVYRFISDRQIALLFQKLGGLLGAYLEVERPGILVTTERSLAIQRFTAAHELGHAVLHHRVGLDGDEIIRRSPFASARYDHREVAADAFASMFLMPDFLINAIANQQKWDHESVRDPRVIYQMSLRLGVSYEALARTLVKHKYLEVNESQKILRVPVKDIKADLLGSAFQPDNWHCNVWLLSEKDEHTTVMAEPNDLFVVRLREMSGAGYLWNLEQARKAGYQVLADATEIPRGGGIGGEVERVITARPLDGHPGRFSALQNRPWDPEDVAAAFDFNFEVSVPEVGLPQSLKLRALAA
jgi:Zn-dependent peptidase ImmA (M78 family)